MDHKRFDNYIEVVFDVHKRWLAEADRAIERLTKSFGFKILENYQIAGGEFLNLQRHQWRRFENECDALLKIYDAGEERLRREYGILMDEQQEEAKQFQRVFSVEAFERAARKAFKARGDFVERAKEFAAEYRDRAAQLMAVHQHLQYPGSAQGYSDVLPFLETLHTMTEDAFVASFFKT